MSGALSVIILLALGIGGAAAVFNPIYSLIAAPLPFPQPDRLVRIGGDIPLFNNFGSNFEKRELLARIFSNIAAYESSPAKSKVKVPDTGKTVEISQIYVTEEFFETLAVKPIRGSGFEKREKGTWLIVSHRFWQKELMGADDVIGKPILFDSRQVLIIGVMPETFNFPIGVDFWRYDNANLGFVPYPDSPAEYVGRLRSGISMEQAARDLKAIEFKPGSGLHSKSGPVLQSLQVVFYGDRQPLLLLIGAVAVIFLLLVCASVASLLVSRGIRRKSEITIRLAVGATRCSLVCQLLRETLPLVLIGGAIGFVIAEFVSAVLLVKFPTLKGGEVALPVKMVFFAVIAMAVTVISGLIPALQSVGGDLNTRLKSTSDSKRRFFSSQEILVGVQLSLTLALLIGTGILVRSLMYRFDFQVGWSPQQVIVVSAEFPSNTSASPEGISRLVRFYQEARRQLETMPEVVSVGNLTPLPFTVDALQRNGSSRVYKDFPATDLEEREKQQSIRATNGSVGSNGFDVLDIPLIIGRSFTSTEIDNAVDIRIKLAALDRRLLNAQIAGIKVSADEMDIVDKRVSRPVIVNRALAQSFWPGENAVGNIFYDSRLEFPFEIVGIVSDFHIARNSRTVAPAFYQPITGTSTKQEFLVKLRSNKLLSNFQVNARRRLTDLDAELKWLEMRTLHELVSDTIKEQRLPLLLISCFAALGISISALGVYATSTLMAASRTKEIGIRMAIGAQFSDILRLVLLRGARVLLIGLPCGLFGGWILTRGLSSALSQVRPTDPLVFMTSCATLLCITIIAVLIPALRAARLDPLDSMRKE